MKLKLFFFALFISTLSGCGQLIHYQQVSDSKSLKPSILIHSSKGETLIDTLTNCSQEHINNQIDIRC